MKYLTFLLLFVSGIAQAQAPVEERPVNELAQRHSQIKADFARAEKAKAADRLHQAENEVSEAKQAQHAAEKNLQAAQQRVTSAQKKLTQAQTQYQQAESKAAQAAAEVEQTWKK